MTATYKTPERITSNNSEKVLYELLSVISENSNIIVDMSNTIYISSSALRVFLIANKTLSIKGGKHLKITKTSTYVNDIFQMTGFDSILTIE